MVAYSPSRAFSMNVGPTPLTARVRPATARVTREPLTFPPNVALKWTEGHSCFRPAAVPGYRLAPFTS